MSIRPTCRTLSRTSSCRQSSRVRERPGSARRPQLLEQEEHGGRGREDGHDVQDEEGPFPAVRDLDPGHAVAGHYAAQVAEAVDESGRRRRALLAAEVERDRPAKVRIRADQQEPDQCDNRDRPERGPAKIVQGQRGESHGCQEQANDDDDRPARPAQAIAQESGQEYGDAPEKREQGALAGGLGVAHSQRLVEICWNPGVERLAKQSQAKREHADVPEYPASEKRRQQGPHAGRHGIVALLAEYTVGTRRRLRLADLPRGLLEKDQVDQEQNEHRARTGKEDLLPGAAGAEQVAHELACQCIAEQKTQADERHNAAIGTMGKPPRGDLDHPGPAEGLDEPSAYAREREQGNRTPKRKQDREADRSDHAPQEVAPASLKIGQSTREKLADRVGENSERHN